MQVIALFKAAKAQPPLPANAAPFSGAITWADGLLDRVSGIQHELAPLPWKSKHCLNTSCYWSNNRDLETIILKHCEVQTMPANSIHWQGLDFISKLPAQIQG